MISTALLIVASGLLAPQGQPGAARAVPIYRAQINVVERTIPAVNYSRVEGTTRVDFRGTHLLPAAGGEARVDNREGATRIDARFENLAPANRFGPEYLTYVLWAITPQGRPENLGEVAVRNGRGRLQTTTPLQTFGLLLTAEPYFAVSRPSDAVVLENAVRGDTSGETTTVMAHYELLPRGVYVTDRSQFQPVEPETTRPPELAQAENAVRIAQQAGANRYSVDTLSTALSQLDTARRYWAMGSRNERAVATTARAATQTAEDARLLALGRMEAEQEAGQRAAIDEARQEAARLTAEAERAEEARREALAQARIADADRQAAQAEAASARAAARQALSERDQLRRRLVEQLAAILEARETPRGILISIGDVFFDFDRATLRPAARESLARAAGILLAYPGLLLRLEGHTDNAGAPAYNLSLSQARADAVRNFLVQQGIPAERIASVGLGEDDPVASNETPEGRSLNRRVELVITGEVIGIPTAPAETRQPVP